MRISGLIALLVLAGILSGCDTVEPETSPSLDLLLHVETVAYPLQVPPGAQIQADVVFVVECPLRVRPEREEVAPFHYRLAVYGELIYGGCEPQPGFVQGRSGVSFHLSDVPDTTYRLEVLSPEAIHEVDFRPEGISQVEHYLIRTDLPDEEPPGQVKAILYIPGGAGYQPLDTLALEPIGGGRYEVAFEPPASVSLDAQLRVELVYTYPDRPAIRDYPQRLSAERPAIRLVHLR